MARTTVTKIGNKYLVEGVHVVVAGKIANEPFTAVYKTRNQAEFAAKRHDGINADNLKWLAEVLAARKAEIAEYAAERGARPSLTQLSFF